MRPDTLRKTVNEPIYPSVNIDAYQNPSYHPEPSNNNNSGGKNEEIDKKSPTISQIMRDFDIK